MVLFILKILAALLVLSVLVTVHEFGHCLMAKAVGVRVNEFAIGMGPKLFGWKKKETEYTVRLLPIGGFCAMEGEDDGAPTPSVLGGNSDRQIDPVEANRSFAHKNVWKRMAIVVAGVLMNLILGYVLLLVCNGFLQPAYDDKGTVLFGTTTIAALKEETPAYQSGLRPGDMILSVNGRRVWGNSDLSMEMQNDEDGILAMTVRRTVDGEEQKVSLPAVKFLLGTDEETGRTYLQYDFAILGKERTFWNVFSQSAKDEMSVATMVWRSLVDIVRGRYGLNDLSGPVGTVDVIADAVSNANTLEGWYQFVMLVVLITVNLGVFNLLPFPGLDGGRLVFLVWEAATKKPVPAKWEGIIHFAGLVLLMGFVLLVTYSDVTKLFG